MKMNSLKAELLKTQSFDLLQQVLAQWPGARYMCLGLVDGRVWAFHGASELDPARISAMTTSALGLSEAYAREAKLGSLSYSVLSPESGTIVLVRVPCTSRLFVLSCGFDSSETVAMALRVSLDTAQKLAELIDQADLTVVRRPQMSA